MVALATAVFDEVTLTDPDALLTVMLVVAPSMNATLVDDKVRLELGGGGVGFAVTDTPTCLLVRLSLTVRVAEPTLTPLTVMTLLLIVAFAVDVFDDLTLTEPDALLTEIFAVAPSVTATFVVDSVRLPDLDFRSETLSL
jgi:hypothetical protein